MNQIQFCPACQTWKRPDQFTTVEVVGSQNIAKIPAGGEFPTKDICTTCDKSIQGA